MLAKNPDSGNNLFCFSFQISPSDAKNLQKGADSSPGTSRQVFHLLSSPVLLFGGCGGRRLGGMFAQGFFRKAHAGSARINRPNVLIALG
jgi:hypothetical protein